MIVRSAAVLHSSRNTNGDGDYVVAWFQSLVVNSVCVTLVLLKARRMTGKLRKRDFVEQVVRRGVFASDADITADKYLAITANQTKRRASFRSSYD